MFFPHSPDPNVLFVSDALGSFCCGAILLHSQWLQVEWPSSWSNMNITVKELVSIVCAVAPVAPEAGSVPHQKHGSCGHPLEAISQECICTPLAQMLLFLVSILSV